ncbi:hypothetical protein BO82DRAFT_401302 [Aspergillus uvarum CBS 121591]|uniref:Uncharacterized protein n=1 Tax=Aspergillus uvarum CBS 121591 TaxID=1448315 RepID=A0A319CEI9_9EURO|nr:hypothetical protein BO82DRAFT_401302 [Aspergillus uvarum CBS 121591]PYH82659.1 hypothetical protein BO82DRAFT_401302 [Aspergillus uvarum CBS 121591]
MVKMIFPYFASFCFASGMHIPYKCWRIGPDGEAHHAGHVRAPGHHPTPRTGDIAAAVERASQSSSLDVINEYFADPTVKVALPRFVTEIQLAHPRTPGTSLMGYLAKRRVHHFLQRGKVEFKSLTAMQPFRFLM